MKKLGFGKRSDGDDDSNRLALFGSRSKSKSPAPQENPYARPIPTDPYTRAKINAGVIPPPGAVDNRPGDNRNGPASSGLGGAPDANSGYAPNRFGSQTGYGANRYGGSSGPRSGPGGYGGLGSVDPNNPAPDANREALFGGAQERYQNRQSNPPPYTAGTGPNDPATSYTSATANYSTYQEKQMTAEEEEEENVEAVKQETKFVKQGDVSATRNALRVAAEAEEAGRNTLARLGAQGERILDAENALDMAATENRIAEEKSRELKKLNGSMFAVHVSNPFTSAQRQRDRDEKILRTHRDERDTREGTRYETFRTNQRMERTFKDIEREANKASAKAKTNFSERAKYQFEADSEDDAMEDEIEQNLGLLSGAASRLNGIARATGKEIEEQNRHLDRIMGKSDFVDDQLVMNRSKLDRMR